MSETIGQRRDQEIADHQSDKRRGEDRTEELNGKAPLVRDHRGRIADGLGVEPIEEHDEATQADHAVLEGTDTPFVDETGQAQC
ncbi:hypothetical protein [Pseudonocardia yunnanensis]|uniref:DUF5709 domain-containing protein n=1 Tax=Pseudonocardia yunnanensis TaxID=58107 RepID=A0ABW4EPH2_9PSEU